MEKVAIIRHEEKNQFGRTLFAIDAVIGKDLFLWYDKKCCFYPQSLIVDQAEKEMNALIDGEYFFLTLNIIIHLPLRLEDKNSSVQKKKNEVFDYISSNHTNHLGIEEQLKELAMEILHVRHVEKLFLPDFALNE